MKKIIALIIALPIMVHAVEHKAVDRFNNVLNTYVAQPSPDNAALVLAELEKSQGNEKLKEIFATRLDLKAVNVNDLNQQVRMFRPEAKFVDFSVPKHVTVRPTLASQKNKDAFEKKKVVETAKALINQKLGETSDSRTVRYTNEQLRALENQLQGATQEETQRIFNDITQAPDAFITKKFSALTLDTKGGNTLIIGEARDDEPVITEPVNADETKAAQNFEAELAAFEALVDGYQQEKEEINKILHDTEVPLDDTKDTELEKEEAGQQAASDETDNELIKKIAEKESEIVDAEIGIIEFLALGVTAGSTLAATAAALFEKRRAADALKAEKIATEIAFLQSKAANIDYQLKTKENRIRLAAEKAHTMLNGKKAADITPKEISALKGHYDALKKANEKVTATFKETRASYDKLSNIKKPTPAVAEKRAKLAELMNKLVEDFERKQRQIQQLARELDTIKASQEAVATLKAEKLALEELLSTQKQIAESIEKLSVEQQNLKKLNIDAIKQELTKAEQTLSSRAKTSYLEFTQNAAPLKTKASELGVKLMELSEPQKQMVKNNLERFKREFKTLNRTAKTQITDATEKALEKAVQGYEKLLAKGQLSESAVSTLNRGIATFETTLQQALRAAKRIVK